MSIFANYVDTFYQQIGTLGLNTSFGLDLFAKKYNAVSNAHFEVAVLFFSTVLIRKKASRLASRLEQGIHVATNRDIILVLCKESSLKIC